jgi:cytochrome c oxidase subunit 2
MFFEQFLDQASSYAANVDLLFMVITIVVGIWFIMTEGVFFYLMARYAHKEGQKAIYMTGDGHEKHWVHIPHYLVIVCDIVLIAGAIIVWNQIKIDRPEAESKIRVIGQQWAWTFVHPGPDNVLDTDDDIIKIDELHVKKGITYHFELQAKDVLHSFFVPVFRLKQDAVPGRTITGWFRPIKSGEYDIVCAEMCGIGHGIMAARLFIEDEDMHQFWLEQNATTPLASNE